MSRNRVIVLTMVLGVLLTMAITIPVLAQREPAASAGPENGAAPAPVLAPSQIVSITILHTNDFHGHVDEWVSGGTMYGGSARIATKVEEFRDAQDNVLLLDAGDQFQGTLFYSLFKADIVTVTMNALGYDAMAVGNHEFDDGPSELARLIDGVDFPVLSANIEASAEPSLAGKIKPSTIITVSGEPIGIVGLTTPETAYLSSPGPNVTFSDTVTSLQAAVDQLTAQGIDKIIALTHLGYVEDVALAQAVRDVDVIVGGHSHTEVDPPTEVNDLDGNTVVIVQAGSWGEYLGHLDVTFSTTGTVGSYAGELIEMDDTIAKDPTVEAIVAAYRPQVEELKNTFVGTTTVALPLYADGRRICRMGECLLGDLVADAMLWKVNSVSPDPYHIAVQNGGGLRAPIDAGPIGVGEILEVLPFGNAIATFEITGTHVISALENGVSAVETGAGRFPQVSGMRYTWDPNAPAGSRIVSVQVYDGDSGTYVPLDEDAVYRVVTNDFMRTGGDGYDVFRDYAIDPYDFGPALDEALKEYVEQFSPISPALDGRVLSLGPDIFVTPLELDVDLVPGKTATSTVTVSNKGDQPLDWSLTVSPTVDWLAVDPTGGTLTPEEVTITGTATLLLPKSIDVTATFSQTMEGTYTTTLVITSNDADEPTINVEVTLTAAFYRILLPVVMRNYSGL